MICPNSHMLGVKDFNRTECLCKSNEKCIRGMYSGGFVIFKGFSTWAAAPHLLLAPAPLQSGRSHNYKKNAFVFWYLDG